MMAISAAKDCFPYRTLREEPCSYVAGSERYEASYIKREAQLLIHYSRDKMASCFGDIGAKTQLTDRDRRILRRWGIK